MSAYEPPEVLDIVWPRLIAIADEMATTVFRTAFSHDVEVPADSGSMPTWQLYVNGVRPDGEAFALHQHAFGGMGGRPGGDGLASVMLSLQRA